MATTAQIQAAYDKAGTWTGAAKALAAQGHKLSRDTCRRRCQKRPPPAAARTKVLPFELQTPLEEPINIVELKRERIRKFNDQMRVYQNSRIIRVNVNVDGPIGIGWVGDPHVDDDGTDISLLFEHARIFDGRNEGMFAANIGDVWNNWVGKLMRLWSEQSTSAAEARALVTEYLHTVRWLLFCKGNHEAWSGGNDIIDYILQDHALITKATRAQIVLVFPNGREVEVYAAHDFKGRSVYSPSFGPAKKAKTHHWGRIYVCGHLHDAAYQHGFHDDGRMWHALRLASYKKIDEYVEQLDIEPSPGYECPVSIIDPYATSEMNLIRFEFDPHEAAERLKWMRARHNGAVKKGLIKPSRPHIIKPSKRVR